jgi:L-2,4-diaminobutyric acid acetyltransferase
MHSAHTHQPALRGTANIVLRKPTSLDGSQVHALIERCTPLDRNSLYCNLLQCSLFAATCVIAEDQHQPAGFASAFLLPESPKTLFIWQVAVAPEARGLGLASKMILELLARPICQQVNELQTSITPDNRASWSLFESLAKKLSASLQTSPLFDRIAHFHSQHQSETLVTLSHFSASTAMSSLQSKLMTLT